MNEDQGRKDPGLEQEDLPHHDQSRIDQEAERSREEMDRVPEPGTDPLHEGP